MIRKAATPRTASASVNQKKCAGLDAQPLGQTPMIAVVAAGDVAPLECDRPCDLGEGERQHCRVDAGIAHAEPAEHQRAREAESDSRSDRDAHR